MHLTLAVEFDKFTTTQLTCVYTNTTDWRVFLARGKCQQWLECPLFYSGQRQGVARRPNLILYLLINFFQIKINPAFLKYRFNGKTKNKHSDLF